MKKYTKFFLPLAMGVMLCVSTYTLGQSVKLNPIKPSTVRPVTDEQQAILAVRKAKASVVNILGNIKIQEIPIIKFEASEISGTGFVWSGDGYIVTNYHVVSTTGEEYTVVLANGEEFPVKVVGFDKYNDIALLKIETTGLTPAALGDSGGLETGQSVFAIGNSLGKYQNTVTRGVVSGVERAVAVGEETNLKPRLQNLIQTDAAINPGNSGGPLINMAGEVVGMNTLVDSTAQGIGFAVPINAIKTAVEQIKSVGKVSRAYMGASFMTITRIYKELHNLASAEGALVFKVEAGGPADKAGLKPNDIILEINRKKITQLNHLDTEISRYEAGNQVLVSLLRNGQKMEMLMILGEYK